MMLMLSENDIDSSRQVHIKKILSLQLGILTYLISTQKVVNKYMFIG